jgi:hypothetical protein
MCPSRVISVLDGRVNGPETMGGSEHDLVGQRVALIISWDPAKGAGRRGVFFGVLQASARGRGLCFTGPGVILELPSGWLKRIARVPPEQSKQLEHAPYFVAVHIDEVPAAFQPAELVRSGF